MLTIVIPAFNEQDNIVRCVTSVRQHVPSGLSAQVVVVDNNSTDATAALARRAGATVVQSAALTIGGVRNDGVEAATGDLLMFLDADCVLTAQWHGRISEALETFQARNGSALGSHPIPPTGEDVFLWRHWFVPLFQQDGTSHIGSGHLICRRADFIKIGGFDATLVASEDVDLCHRLQKARGPLLLDRALTVEHYGYPRTWSAFFRRERWHGRGDVVTLRSLLSSKVGTLSLGFALGVVIALVGVIVGETAIVALGALCALAVLFASAVVKFRHAGVKAVAVGAAIFAVYYTARAVALCEQRPAPRHR
jgi:glycosyltransferase involved in cell wall biosynthesis